MVFLSPARKKSGMEPRLDHYRFHSLCSHPITRPYIASLNNHVRRIIAESRFELNCRGKKEVWLFLCATVTPSWVVLDTG
jgi:hypothetical protein